jgi:Flp pilus assembly protein CpaB
VLPATPTLDRAARRRRLVRDLRRRARRYRRWAGAALLGLSALLALSVVAPAPPATVQVTVAARDLPAGSVLTETDVAVATLVEGAWTPRSLDVAEVVGEVLAAPVSVGEPLTETRLRGATLLTGVPPGTVALPVRLADPGAAALVSGGDRIDLLAAVPGDGATAVRTVGSDLPVLLAPAATSAVSTEPDGVALLGGSDAGTDLLGGLLVVAASPEQVPAIIGGASDGPLWLALRANG